MNWLTYANQGATRNQPLSDDLVEALSFMPEMGLALKVFSGGQPAKGSGKPRVGSTRHDHGHAADAFLYRDGERLDWANPEQQPIFQEFVRRARANGVTGIGAGDGYMQPGSMHIGFGNDAVWGAGGKGANAPSWLREATGQAPNQNIADGAMRAIGKDPIRQTSTATAVGGQGADTMQQSTGLLGQLARPEDKVGGLLGMMFKNMTPDRADQIRAGLAGLYGNENQGVYNAATQRMGDRKAQRRDDTALAREQAEQQQAAAQAAQQREAAARFALEHGDERLARGIMDGLVSPSKVYELANPEKPNPTDDMREYAAAQAQGFTGTLQEWILSQRKAGAASSNVTVGGQPSNIGTIPQGVAVIPDETDPSGYRMVPIPGGPEDTTAQNAVKAGNATVATDTIITAADRARQAAAKQNFGSSGTSLVGMLPFTDSAEVIRQVDVLKSQAKVSNLQSMRDASKTGGALGAVSAPELKMLEDQSGALDPNSPNFLRDLDQYEKTLLNVVHGPEAGARIYLETRKDPAGAPKVLRFNADGTLSDGK